MMKCALFEQHLENKWQNCRWLTGLWPNIDWKCLIHRRIYL